LGCKFFHLRQDYKFAGIFVLPRTFIFASKVRKYPIEKNAPLQG
jgi:hypothetical protein